MMKRTIDNVRKIFVYRCLIDAISEGDVNTVSALTNVALDYGRSKNVTEDEVRALMKMSPVDLLNATVSEAGSPTNNAKKFIKELGDLMNKYHATMGIDREDSLLLTLSEYDNGTAYHEQINFGGGVSFQECVMILEDYGYPEQENN